MDARIVMSSAPYAFPPNERKLEAISLQPGVGGGELTLVVRLAGTEQKIACGHGMWRKGRLAYGSFPEQPIAASGAWTGEDTYTAKLSFYETPFCLTMALRFSGDEVVLDSEFNVGFGPTREPTLTGTSARVAPSNPGANAPVQ